MGEENEQCCEHQQSADDPRAHRFVAVALAWIERGICLCSVFVLNCGDNIDDIYCPDENVNLAKSGNKRDKIFPLIMAGRGTPSNSDKPS